MTKANIITQIAGLSDDAPELNQIGAILRGDVDDGGPATLSISDGAKRAGCGRSTVYRAIESGALKVAPLYHGGRSRIRVSDFKAWLADGRAGK
jgi:excisionase family DNA binding protein